MAQDLKRIKAVLGNVGNGRNLAGDANSKFHLQRAIEFGRATQPYKLRSYEKSGDLLDYALQSELVRPLRITSC